MPDATKPYEDEHACRLQEPDQFDSFRRENDAATINGRSVDFVFGLTDDGDTSELQSVRYPLAEGWDEGEAREHCTEQDGILFEPAEGAQDDGIPHATANTMRTTKSPGGKTVTTTTRADSVVTREVDGEEIEMLRVPISSTHQDRDGDAFSEDALQRMAEQIRAERPLVHDDHGAVGGGMFSRYSARETIGTQMDAEVEEGDDEHSTLFAYINPDGTHPDGEGERMLAQVKEEKQAIKFSVGFGILRVADDLPDDDRPERANEIPGRLFMEADLMETSRVGIPANPVASANAGIEAIKGAAEGRVPVAFMTPEQLAQVDRDVVGEATPTQVDGQGRTTTKDHDMTQTNDADGGGSTDTKAFDDVALSDYAALLAASLEDTSADELMEAWDGFTYTGEADRGAVVSFVSTATDADTGAVEDALDDLMDGDGEGEEESAENPDGEAGSEAEGTEPDDADSVTPEERLETLETELAEVRESVEERGEPETGDTTAADPDDTDDTEPDETDDDTTTNEHETLLE